MSVFSNIRWVAKEEFELTIAQPIRFGAVIRTKNSLSLGDLRRNGAEARELVRRYRSTYLFSSTIDHGYSKRWPGTEGPRALVFLFQITQTQPFKLAQLLNRETWREWEDIFVYDSRGIAALSVTHERLIGTRASGKDSADDLVFDSKLNPETVAFLNSGQS
jgi:hypothetical protein